MRGLLKRCGGLIDRWGSARRSGVGALCAVVLTLMTGPWAAGQYGAPGVGASPDIERDLNIARSLSNAFKYAAAKVEPAVVHITTRELVNTARPTLFGMTRTQPLVRTGLGSGVIIDPVEGLILTNNHVAGAANGELRVRLYDGRELPGRLVGADDRTDIAVVQIDADGLVAAPLGDSDAVSVGEWVIAVGSPFGLDQTVTAGIVSAKGRQLPGESGSFGEYIQTDASINPGNSGGPLVNLNGEIVGINTAIISNSRQSAGLGFAVPAAIADSVLQAILSNGTVRRGWLGITMDELKPDQRRGIGLRPDEGVGVVSVVPGSPADRAGLKAGDIVLAFDGREVVGGISRLTNLIQLTEPGARVNIEILRGEQTVELTTRLIDDREGELLAFGATEIPELGVVVGPIPIDVVRELRLRQPEGLFIFEVEPGGPADRVGIEQRDIVIAADGRAIKDADDLRRRIGMARRAVRLDITRGSLRGYVDIQPGR